MKTLDEYLDQFRYLQSGPGFCDCEFCVTINRDLWQPFAGQGELDEEVTP